MDLFADTELESAKRQVDDLFRAALAHVRDPDVDPGYWFSRRECCLPYLGHLPQAQYTEFLEYVDQAWEWLRLNHPQPGVFVPYGIGSDPHMEVH